MVKNVLLVIKSPPYGSGRAAEGFRMATAMIAMDILPQLLFIDDGVYCLLKGQEPEAALLASLDERLKTLADLIGLQVLEISLTERNLQINDLNENYNMRMVSLEEATVILMESDAVVTF